MVIPPEVGTTRNEHARERSVTESRLLTGAVAEFARRTRFPVVFGGLMDREGLTRVTAFHGNRTDALRGLSVARDRGLGGRAVTELRPRMAGDYASARQITHDYDSYILGEGIGTLIAVPVVVDRVPRGVLYGGVHGNWSIGGVSAEPAVRVAEEFARKLAENDERRRREAEAAARPSLSPAQQEELRSTYTELRLIGAELDDGALRERLADIERRLAALSAGMPVASAAGDGDVGGADAPAVRLSPRETDVLACAALGSTNAGIAEQLGLRESTVKAYLGAAMSKLDASTRHAAVAAARRHGLLP